MVLVLASFCSIHNMSMIENLDVRLPPWFAFNNSALKGNNSLKKNSNFY